MGSLQKKTTHLSGHIFVAGVCLPPVRAVQRPERMRFDTLVGYLPRKKATRLNGLFCSGGVLAPCKGCEAS